MKSSIEKSQICKVPIEIEKVWNIVTDSSKFYSLNLPGNWGVFNNNEAQRGTIFKYNGVVNQASKPVDCYIVEWNEPNLFSFGYEINEWTFKFELRSIQNKVTEIKFSRKFWNRSEKRDFIGWLFNEKSKEEIVPQTFVDETIRRIKIACNNLRDGNPDGLKSRNYL